MGLPGRMRLRSPRRIREVIERGSRADGRLGVVYALPSREPGSRLAQVFSRRLGNAPDRNRGRRRIQEAFRELEATLDRSWDVVFRGRRGVLGQPLATVAEDFGRLVERATVLESNPDDRRAAGGKR